MLKDVKQRFMVANKQKARKLFQSGVHNSPSIRWFTYFLLFRRGWWWSIKLLL